jgi:hypothetical protein
LSNVSLNIIDSGEMITLTISQRIDGFCIRTWAPVWVALLWGAVAIAKSCVIVPSPSAPTEVSPAVFSAFCVGILLCLGGVLLTVVANECKKTQQHMASWALLSISMCAWTFGLLIVMIVTQFHPELTTAMKIAG